MGTPAFAVPSLHKLMESGYGIAAVVTAPDRPAGRGQKPLMSEVKQFALKHGLKVLQPERLGNPEFLEELRSLCADLFVVVAFRMLPESVWSMPRLGTFNLHGSLLPQYRGAAPINRAVMNGEKITGVTTFFIRHEIDTGGILFQEQIELGQDDTAGEVHDKLMEIGANLVVKTADAIVQGKAQAIEQEQFISDLDPLQVAPKIFRDDCRLDFSGSVTHLHNQVRGLSPYPGAFFEFILPDGTHSTVKVLRSKPEAAGTVLTHTLLTDGKSEIKVSCADGFLHLLELQLPGKKRMSAAELLRGYRFPEGATIA
ncbi:MAG: methionyl-tRNA formyltransferase [Bacteroidota bacterium]